MELLMSVLIALMLLVAFDLAALRWGHDSRNRIESSEWEHRIDGGCPRHHSW